jgi:hypothetical protein
MIDFSKLNISTLYTLIMTQASYTKKKEYTSKVGLINPSIMYIFENYDEFKAYFNKYGVDDENTINEVARITDPSGVIFANKLICDTQILYYKKIKDFEKRNTPKKALKYALVKEFENNFKKQD